MRLTRRQLIGSVSLVAAAAATRPLRALAESSISVPPLVVGDSRFPASLTFTRALAPQDWLDVRVDAAMLWYQRLREAARESRIVIGMTTAADAAILRSLAQEELMLLTELQREPPILVTWTLQAR